MRKVIFTESQLKQLLGEDIGAYLGDKLNDIPQNSYGTEVNTSDNIDGVHGIEPTNDKIGGEKVAGHPFLRRSNYGIACESKKKSLNEANKDLVNKSLRFPPNIRMELQYALNNADKSSTSYKRLSNLVNSDKITTNEAYRILNDFQNVSYDKQSVIPNSVISWLKQQLNTMTSISRSQKETKQKLGMDNAFQQPGYTKNKGNGMAHTNKNNNNVSFTYEN